MITIDRRRACALLRAPVEASSIVDAPAGAVVAFSFAAPPLERRRRAVHFLFIRHVLPASFCRTFTGERAFFTSFIGCRGRQLKAGPQ